VVCLARKRIDSDDTILSSNILLACTAERIEALAHGNVAETDSAQKIDEFSLRESAGNSASPKIDISSCRFGKFASDDDIAIKEPSTRLKNAKHFTVCD
jgi:hypothetical protein